MIWPTARSTSLAGAMTGLADEVDATYFNPAGLAFQGTAKADIAYAHWLPGLQPSMHYVYAAGGVPLRVRALGHRLYVSGSCIYLTTGAEDIVNERGDFLGRVNVWNGAAAVHAAILLTSKLGAGIALKATHNTYYDDWDEKSYAGTAPAADLAVLYRPLSSVSIGATVANLGPTMVYRPSGEAFSMPHIARLGLCWTPVEKGYVRLRLMPELDKVLVGMFSDTTGKSFGGQLHEEWRDVWKAVGVEATAFNLVSLRLGYLEDLTNQRGGIIFENEDGQTYHYGIWDAMTRTDLGKLERVGICWGLGFGSDKLRFDFSSDAAIYDFPTSNWKIQLTSNDVGGLLRRRS